MDWTIWKYPLHIDDVVTVMMPTGALPLTVQMQGETPCLWALVDPEASREPVQFRIVGTGHPVDFRDTGKYVATFQMLGGRLVFHVFQLPYE